MSKFICGARHKTWTELKLKDYGDFAECVEYVGQYEDGPDSYAGHWWYGDDETFTLYTGSFANDHSPGSSHNTYAEVFEDEEDYRAAVLEWQAKPEYLEEEGSMEEEETHDPSEHGCSD